MKGGEPEEQRHGENKEAHGKLRFCRGLWTDSSVGMQRVSVGGVTERSHEVCVCVFVVSKRDS